jgi:hypothetical protein
VIFGGHLHQFIPGQSLRGRERLDGGAGGQQRPVPGAALGPDELGDGRGLPSRVIVAATLPAPDWSLIVTEIGTLCPFTLGTVPQ